jgi:hypothetical protein
MTPTDRYFLSLYREFQADPPASFFPSPEKKNSVRKAMPMCPFAPAME